MDCDEIEIEATKNMKEKTADEMFEELGLKKIRNDNEAIIYDYSDNFGKLVEFSIKIKCIRADFFWFDMDVLKAINKKCEELGWL